MNIARYYVYKLNAEGITAGQFNKWIFFFITDFPAARKKYKQEGVSLCEQQLHTQIPYLWLQALILKRIHNWFGWHSFSCNIHTCQIHLTYWTDYVVIFGAPNHWARSWGYFYILRPILGRSPFPLGHSTAGFLISASQKKNVLPCHACISLHYVSPTTLSSPFLCPFVSSALPSVLSRSRSRLSQ